MRWPGGIGNTGILNKVQENDTAQSQGFYRSVEYQGDLNQGMGQIWSLGSIRENGNMVNGGWITMGVESHGHDTTRHFVDGELVMEYRNPRIAPRNNANQVQKPLTSGVFARQSEGTRGAGQATDGEIEGGDPVQLRGVASHGMQWFNTFYGTGKAFAAAADEWGADILRLTIYLSEDGCLTSKKITRDSFDIMIDNYVKTCVQKGIYIILDWHAHKPGYPSYYQAQAKDFFSRMAAKYGDLPNVLWEICNEPSSAGFTAAQSGSPSVTDPGHDVR